MDTKNRIDKLSPEKRRLLSLLREREELERQRKKEIPIRPSGEHTVMSFAQQRLWFLDQLEPTTRYNVPAAVRLSGRLDIRALRGSLSEIVRRHEVLRTHFEVVGAEPMQVIGPVRGMSLPVVDYMDLPSSGVMRRRYASPALRRCSHLILLADR